MPGCLPCLRKRSIFPPDEKRSARTIIPLAFPGFYIPAPTSETGHVFARFRSQKPARFPAEQKERSIVETLLFPVSRGRRYNTLYFAIPAIKRLRRSLASLGDCKQSLSLVRRCRTSCKVVCHETAGFFGFFRPKGTLPPLESSFKKQNRMCSPIKHIPFCFS